MEESNNSPKAYDGQIKKFLDDFMLDMYKGNDHIIARKYFNGGGHFNAAGGKNKEPLEEVIAKFKRAIKENKEQLNN